MTTNESDRKDILVNNGEVTLYYNIYQDDPIHETARKVWELIQYVYENYPDKRIILALDIDNFDDDLESLPTQLKLFIENVCNTIVAGVVDELILPHQSPIDTSEKNITDTIKEDKQLIESDPSEDYGDPTDHISDDDGFPDDMEIHDLSKDNISEDLTNNIVVLNNRLIAEWNESEQSLNWGLIPLTP